MEEHLKMALVPARAPFFGINFELCTPADPRQQTHVPLGRAEPREELHPLQAKYWQANPAREPRKPPQKIPTGKFSLKSPLLLPFSRSKRNTSVIFLVGFFVVVAGEKSRRCQRTLGECLHFLPEVLQPCGVVSSSQSVSQRTLWVRYATVNLLLGISDSLCRTSGHLVQYPVSHNDWDEASREPHKQAMVPCFFLLCRSWYSEVDYLSTWRFHLTFLADSHSWTFLPFFGLSNPL